MLKTFEQRHYNGILDHFDEVEIVRREVKIFMETAVT